MRAEKSGFAVHIGLVLEELESEQMGSVEKLQRRNLDFKLLGAIKSVGVQNYSLLARLTGLNAETIRYKVNKHMTRLGLTTTINVNYGELGLSMGYIAVIPNGTSGKSWLDRMSYLVFVAKSIGSNRYLCLSAVPFRLKKKYMDALEQIKQEGLIESYEYRELYWVRYPPFRPEFYDFEERRWKMDWSRFDMTMGEIGSSFLSVNRDSVVDFVDLKILSALLKDPTTPLAKTAKEMGVNPRTVRYHHSEHVEKNKFILSHNIRWVKPLQEGNPGGVMQALIVVQKLDEEGMSRVRKFFNSLPFTWLEAGTVERDYLAVIDIPLFEFQTCMQQIEMHLMQAGRAYEVMMLDASKTKPLSIPDEMFEEKRGWRLYSEIEIGRRETKEEGA